MPLNMNTVGTGSGIGGNSGNVGENSQLLAPANVTPQDYGNVPAYYIKDYSSMLPKTNANCTKITSAPDGIMRLIYFKKQLWAIRLMSMTYYSSLSGYNGTVTISKLSSSTSSLTATDVASFSFLGYGTGWVRSGNVVIPGKDYLYFVERVSVTYDYNGNSRSTDVLTFSRFDGKTIERINYMYSTYSAVLTDNSWFKGNGYADFITEFTMIDPKTETLLIGINSTLKKVVMSTNPPTVSTLTQSGWSSSGANRYGNKI